MTDLAIVAVLEFKAITVFSLLFGAGLAVFAGRAHVGGVSPLRFLARRLLVLLAFGLVHLLLVWNGDILTLYAVCGFLILPLLRLPPMALVVAGVVAFAVPHIWPWLVPEPGEGAVYWLAEDAARVYRTGTPAEVLAYRWRETRLLVLPLLVAILPRTLGLMALGAAAWKAGVLRDPGRHGRLLLAVAVVGGLVGATATAASVYSASTGAPHGFPDTLVAVGSSAPLALAYTACLLLTLRSPALLRLATPFAAVGRMALTNYLTQSVVLSLLFYGYGLGLYGRTGSAAAAGIGLALCALQAAFSVEWLRRFRFGPAEWLWRTLTYGRPQPVIR
jgi:uncharacterized protein